MGITPAHAVVALPFAGSGRWSSAALACGAIAPDLPLFLTGGAGYGWTHAAWAVPSLDLVLGLACLAVWWALVRPGLLAVLPGGVRARVGPRRRTSPALIPAGVAVGAATHLLWDGFTHTGRLGSELLPVLRERLGPFPLTSWVQYLSGAVGLGVLVLVGVQAFRRAPRRAIASALGRAAAPTGVAVLVVPALTATIAFVPAWMDGGVRSGAFAAVTGGLGAAGLALLLVGGVVRVLGHPRRSASTR